MAGSRRTHRRAADRAGSGPRGADRRRTPRPRRTAVTCVRRRAAAWRCRLDRAPVPVCRDEAPCRARSCTQLSTRCRIRAWRSPSVAARRGRARAEPHPRLAALAARRGAARLLRGIDGCDPLRARLAARPQRCRGRILAPVLDGADRGGLDREPRAAGIAFIRILVVLENKPRETRIVSDLLAGAIFVCAALAIANLGFALPVRGLLATSGVVAIVLGLALQSTLADVFSGIAVGLERPYKPGDLLWVEGAIEGAVREVNWRSTQIATGDRNVAVVPNSGIAKARRVNRSAPSPARTDTVTIRLDAATPRERAVAVRAAAVRNCRIPLAGPPPVLACTGPGRRWEPLRDHLLGRLLGRARTRARRDLPLRPPPSQARRDPARGRRRGRAAPAAGTGRRRPAWRLRPVRLHGRRRADPARRALRAYRAGVGRDADPPRGGGAGGSRRRNRPPHVFGARLRNFLRRLAASGAASVP